MNRTEELVDELVTVLATLADRKTIRRALATVWEEGRKVGAMSGGGHGFNPYKKED